ncbi:T9SS type A sorting domain-containing protein [Polaribacter gangjinensis]|uniref:Secretion system C-terminal sorting domain-containing protein n=1 Tax=Polaribacter gangjinensis TaxID=574710 RepID=A0A2S7W950_9FLAO|nr:T9SS type A sorting domain-containing protein [Polaribacter gangjinensis]PQJ74164.1 hypothetical protein BTO13_02240 [Polaribacter gangjinensis]
MKHLLILISIIYSINCFGQEPNPELFQTWYLYSVMASDGSPSPYIVSEINPNITPSLTIVEDLTFSGIGACNSFNGTFIFSNNTLSTDQFSNLTNECGIQIHKSFETEYFNFMEYAIGYQITSENDGLVLNLSTAVFGEAVFKNFKLNIKDFDLNKIEIYPNPTNSIIYIKSKNTSITKIEFLNSFGQTMRIIKSKFESIDISNLSAGIYMMKIYSEFGIQNRKILKK